MRAIERNFGRNILLLGLLGLILATVSACATQRYGRLTPLSPGERASLNCQAIDAEIEKADFFLQDVRRQRSKTTGAHVLGALGDFGIGNAMEGDAAEESGHVRKGQLEALSAEKGCQTDGIAATRMSADNIRRYFSDTTRYGTNAKGYDWAVYYDPSGEVRAVTHAPRGDSYDNGTWLATEDDMLCIEYNRWHDGERRCWVIYVRNGQLTFVTQSGQAAGSSTDTRRVVGNSERL